MPLAALLEPLALPPAALPGILRRGMVTALSCLRQKPIQP